MVTMLTRRVSAAVVAAGILVAAILLILMTASARAVAPEEMAASVRNDAPTMKTPIIKGQQFAPDQLIVKFKKEVSREQQINLRLQEGLHKTNDLDLIDAEVVSTEGQPIEEALSNLNDRPEVAYAEPNYKVYPTGYTDEPYFGYLWGLNNTGQFGGTSNVDINGPEAYTVTQGDPKVVVAVIDQGVDFSHPDLADRAWVNPGEIPGNGKDDDHNGYIDDVNGYDFRNDDNSVYDPGQDFHGTHVAGTIAASVNDKGVVGVAPEVKIMALKFIGPWGGRTSDAIEAIEYAKAEGVKISNNSWGGGHPSLALKEAIEKSDSLFVAASGNWGGNNDGRHPDYPSSYDSPNILSVAAINNKGKLPRWSNYGAKSVDISAPGVGVLSSVPGMPPGTSGAVLSSVGTSGGKALTVGFGAEEIGDSVKRQSFFEKAFKAVDHKGQQQVVLVDDDQSDNQSGWDWYPDVGATLNSDIQSATGSAPQEIDVPYWANGPSYEELSGKTVVWATGHAYNSYWSTTLTSADQETLTRFLNDGGKLIITGTDALYGMEDTTFVTETLNLDVMSDVGGESLTGATGTMFAGESYAFNGATAYAPYHDKVAPAASAAVSQGTYAAFDKWEPFSGTSMAAPHVTGTAALVASVNPVFRKDPAGLKGVIMHTGKSLSATFGKTVTGDMVNAKKAVVIPIITSVKPNPGLTVKDRTPAVGANVRDAVTDMRKSDIRLRIDGKATTAFSYDRDIDRLSYTPKETLSYGIHSVRVEATDREHNKGWRQWTFKVIERR